MKKTALRTMRKVSLFSVILILALAIAAPAIADEGDADLARKGFSGTVTELNFEAGNITVETQTGAYTARLDGNMTTFCFPSRITGIMTLAEAAVQSQYQILGQQVAVLAQVETDGSLTALRIMVKPERPQVVHWTGTIIEINGDIVTIMDGDGNEYIIQVPPQFLSRLEMGDVATFVVKLRSRLTVGEGIAYGALNAKQVRDRLVEHARIMQQQANAGNVSWGHAEERIEFLTNLMQAHQDHLQGVFDRVLEKAPDKAKGALERARERAMTGLEQAKQAIQKHGPGENKGKPK